MLSFKLTNCHGGLHLAGTLPTQTSGTNVIVSNNAVLDLEQTEVYIANPLLAGLVGHNRSGHLEDQV